MATSYGMVHFLHIVCSADDFMYFSNERYVSIIVGFDHGLPCHGMGDHDQILLLHAH